MCGKRVFGEVLVNSIAKSFEMLFSLLLPLLGIFMPGFSAEVPCLDPLACNFMEEGECFFTDENGDLCVIEGCTIEGACNYDPEADIYDGSCEFESCLGCTDSEACNYDETALYDDATCIYYVDCNGICGGDWIEDACGNCDPPNASPMDTVQVYDFYYSGSTESFLPPEGIDAIYFEVYGAQGQTGAGGQQGGLGGLVSGIITEIPAELLISVGSQSGYNGGGVGGYGAPTNSNCSDWNGGVAGNGGGFTSLAVSDFINSSADDIIICIAGGGGGGGSKYCNCCGGSLVEGAGVGGGGGGLDGMDGSGGSNSDYIFEITAGIGGTQSQGGDGGGFGPPHNNATAIPATAGASMQGGNGATEGSYGVGGGGGGGGYFGGGGGGSGLGGSGIGGGGGGGGSSFIHESIINATTTSGQREGHGFVRIFLLTVTCNPGCTLPQACNYNPDSNFDDGSCDYCFCGEGTQWVDSLQACMVTEAALMQACGEGTYWDDLAQACLTIETCQEDLDGDGVIGVNDLLELLSSFGSECAPEPETVEWTCGDPINYHDYNYNTVLIGGQCWFAENLRTQNYSNGDAINTGLNGPEWANATSGAVTLYGEDPSPSCIDYSPTVDSCDPNEALPAFGRIYNWHAVGDPRGLCPAGWHVPSDNDFMELEVFMGIDADEVQGSGWRGTTEGNQLKTETGWHNGGNGSNLYGFDLVPAGARGTSGQYDNAGRNGYLWTSTSPQENSAFYRRIEAGNSQIARGSYVYVEGYPARCLKDTE